MLELELFYFEVKKWYNLLRYELKRCTFLKNLEATYENWFNEKKLIICPFDKQGICNQSFNQEAYFPVKYLWWKLLSNCQTKTTIVTKRSIADVQSGPKYTSAILLTNKTCSNSTWKLNSNFETNFSRWSSVLMDLGTFWNLLWFLKIEN